MSAPVVVGIDGSEIAEHALRFAAREADLRGTRLVVAHAGDLPDYDAGEPAPPEVRQFADILRREAVATVAARHPHVACETVVRDGDPSELLLELGAEAALVVVGTHRFGRLAGFVLGSVSQRVAAQATGPVVAISGPCEQQSGPVLLGASTTPGGLEAMRFAAAEARLRSTTLHVVRAVSAEDWAVLTTEFTATPADLREVAEAQLDAVVVAVTREFPDVDVTAELSMADPFVALLKYAEDAQLTVIGARRADESRLSRLGPVATWLLHHTTGALAVVGHPRAESANAAATEAETAAAP